MHVALGVEDQKLRKKNMKKFIKSNGLQIILSKARAALFEKQEDQQFSKFANYTNSKTCSRYFMRNSDSICVGILALKIYDLIFREMNTVDNVPPTSNREFLLRPTSLATMTQMLFLQNEDLTNELLVFVTNHMNNHYFYFKMKNSGMIELLILNLSSKKNEVKALQILQKFQEVAFDYNSNNLKLGQFSANDLKILQEDKERFQKTQLHISGGALSLTYGAKQCGTVSNNDTTQQLNDSTMKDENAVNRKNTVLSESILLRFLPVPFIKFFYEKGEQEFLKVYNTEFFEESILIWNSQLRNILEKSLKDHFSHVLQNYQSTQANDDPWLQVLDKKFMTIVKYPEIESEVRCGRYYLRVWVDQKKKNSVDEHPEETKKEFFDIPREEEDDFHKNLQSELKYCIYEEQFKDQGKIIILFKACLLAMKRFNKKRLFSLEEVKKILIETCKSQESYNYQVKQIVYIGIKILYEVIKTNSQDLKEILTKIGVEIISEVFNLILTQSYKKQGASCQIAVDRVETKTIIICVQCFNIIMNTYVQAFIDFPPTQRLNLFKQISKLMEIPFKLLAIFNDKELLSEFIDNTRKEGSQDLFTLPANPTNPKPGFFEPIYYQQTTSESMKRPLIKKSVTQGKIARKSFTGIPGITGNLPSQSPSRQQISMLNNKNAIISNSQQKRVYSRDEDLNYNAPLFEIIENSGDRYSIELICQMMRAIAELCKQLTKNPDLYPDIIESGLAWKALKNIFFQLKEEVNTFKDLKIGLLMSTVALKNMISFTNQLTNQGAESFALKSLAKENEKEKLSNFWNCIRAIFAKKIRETLLQQFIIKNNELVFPDQFIPKYFLMQFQVGAEATSELVWDDVTRSELRMVLDEQIQSMEEGPTASCFYKLLGFQYQVIKKELRVDDIFIRHYNNINDRFHPPQIDKFGAQLIEKLNQYLGTKHLVDLTDEENTHCMLLVEAFKNLLIREDSFIINNQDIFSHYIDIFCSVLRLKDPAQIHDKERQSLTQLSLIVLDILIQFTLRGGIYITYLMSHDEFIRLLIRSLYGPEKEFIRTEQVIIIIEIMLSCKELDVKHFLINQGLIFFILNQIFERKERSANLKERIEFVRILLHEVAYTENIFSNFIPNKFFIEFFSHHRDLFLNTPYNLFHLSQSASSSSRYFYHHSSSQQLSGFETPMIANQIQQRSMSPARLQNANNKFGEVESGLMPGSTLKMKQNIQQSNNYQESQSAFTNQQLQQQQQQYNILEQIMSLEREKIKDFLVNQFDAQRFENVFVIWNEDLRKKSHDRVKYNCEQVVRSYDDSDYKVQWDLGKLENPYLDNEIKVKEIIIRIYNKNPAVYIKEKLNTFILEICLELQKVALELFKLRQQNDDEKIQSHHYKKFSILCQKSNLLLTSLLLSLEQLLFNEYNPNRLMASKKDTTGGDAFISLSAAQLNNNLRLPIRSNTISSNNGAGSEARFYKQIIEKVTDQTQVDLEVYQIMGFWLQQQVFMTQIKYMPEAIKITFLQIIFLLLDVGDAIKVLLDNQTLIQFVNESITGILENKFSTAIEEFLILLIVYKMLSKENQIVPLLAARPSFTSSIDAQGSSNLGQSSIQVSTPSHSGGSGHSTTMENLLKILSIRKGQPHVQLIEMILQLMANNLQYREHVAGYIKNNYSKLKIDVKILDIRHEKFEEIIKRIWRNRGKPPTSQEGKGQYDFDKCQKIEDKKSEIAMENINLPLLSKKSVHSLMREDLNFLEEEAKQLHSNTQYSSEQYQSTTQRNTTNNQTKQQQNKQFQNTLGYQPILIGLEVGKDTAEEIQVKNAMLAIQPVDESKQTESEEQFFSDMH